MIIIFSSQTVRHNPSQLVQFDKKTDSSSKYGGLTIFSCFSSFLPKDETRELKSSLLFIDYFTPSFILLIKFDLLFASLLLNSGLKVFFGASVAVD